MPVLPISWFRWDLAARYNVLLAEGMNVIHPITSGGLIFSTDGKFLLIITDSLALSQQKVARLDGYSLAMNVLPLTGLFWSSPGLTIGKRVLFYLISLAILYCTHIAHIYLDLLLLKPPVVLPIGYKIVIYGKILMYAVLWIFTIFWEQAGRMFFPFLLWLLFAYRYFPKLGLGVFGKNRNTSDANPT